MTTLPAAALEQHIIVLGKTGAGKSSVMRSIVERLLDALNPVCIIDPKGDWWGLKSSADGKRAGYPIVIFGGDHADVPLNPHAGAHVAELVATGNRPSLIDLGGWTVADRTRFFIDFAQALFRTARGRRWLVIDEVHNFAPQGKVYDPDAGKMLHWANRLASEGRGKGIQILAASQRPQKVHKDFLTSCETLIAMRVIHPLDRGAVKDWIDGCPDPEKGKEVLGSLASMARGTGWVWSPEIGFGPKRIDFPLFHTYDSFKPQDGQWKALKGWAEVDLDEVKKRLADVVEQAKANDPAELKRQIALLRREVSAQRGAVPVASKVERVDVKAIQRNAENFARRGALAFALVEIEDIAARLERVRAKTQKWLDDTPLPQAIVPKPTHSGPIPLPKAHPKLPTEPPANGAFRPTGTQQRILDALAWYESLGDRSPSLTKIGAVALIDPTGGHFSNVTGPLSTAGLIERGNGTLTLTDAGRALARAPEAASTLADYHDVLRARVRKMKSAGGKTIEMLDTIIELCSGGRSMSTHDLGERVGIDHSGGHFSNMVGPLSTAGLITRRGGTITPTDVLFPEGLA